MENETVRVQWDIVKFKYFSPLFFFFHSKYGLCFIWHKRKTTSPPKESGSLVRFSQNPTYYLTVNIDGSLKSVGGRISTSFTGRIHVGWWRDKELISSQNKTRRGWFAKYPDRRIGSKTGETKVAVIKKLLNSWRGAGDSGKWTVQRCPLIAGKWWKFAETKQEVLESSCPIAAKEEVLNIDLVPTVSWRGWVMGIIESAVSTFMIGKRSTRCLWRAWFVPRL